MTKHFVAHVLAGTAITLFSGTGAFALDANDFSDKLTDTFGMMGIGFAVQSSLVEGADTIVLSGFTFTVPGEEAAEVEGEVIFEGVSETADGGYFAQSARIPDIEFSDEEMAFTLRNAMAQGITIPGEVTLETAMEISYGLVERASAGPILVDAQDETAFGIDLVEFWTDSDPDMTSLTSGFAINGIVFNLGMVPDPEAIEVFEAFGIEQLVANFSGEGTWLPDDGRLELSRMLFDLEDLGRIDLTGAVVGYTREFYEEMMKANLKMAELGEDASTEDVAQIEDAMLAMMMELEIESALLRYEDNSLFMKSLDFVGREQGVDGATFASGLKFMVPMMLTELGNPTFSAMATTAVNAFIDNPQSFEIAIAPDQPIGISAFENLDDDLNTLIDILNIELRANQ